MTGPHAREIEANLDRAEQSVQAARALSGNGYHDFATSRAYYAVFYAATALLLSQDLEASKHSGVLALVHLHFVKTGRLGTAHGKVLNLLFELRGVADYGVTEHVSPEEAEEAVKSAEAFLSAVKSLLGEAS